MNRRNFLASTAGLLAARTAAGQSPHDMSAEIADYQKPVFNLHSFFSSP